MPNQKKISAQATTTVHKYGLVKYDKPLSGPILARAHIEENFSGDITGQGVGEVLQAADANGSANFVGIERVTGEIAGKKGTFLLQITGTIEEQIVSSSWFVVPNSGTGELADLRGDGGFRANLGKGSDDVHLNYWFE